MKPGNRQRFAEMVPIHTKRFALRDKRQDGTFVPFCSLEQKGFFIAL